MAPVEIVMGVILLVLSVFLLIAVLLQSGKDKSLSSTIAGSGETFFGKQKGKRWDKILSTLTTVFSVLFISIVIIMYIIIK